MTTETNEQSTGKTPETEAGIDADLERIAKSATRIGTVWARYGIEIGRAALVTSAATLESTAEMLGSVASTLERVRDAGVRDRNE